MRAAYNPHEVIATITVSRSQFISAFLVVLSITYGFFVIIDFVPEKPTPEGHTATAAHASSVPARVSTTTDNNVSNSTTTTRASMPDTLATRTTSHTSEQPAQNENEIATAAAEPSHARRAENTPDTEQVDVTARASAEPELPVRIEIDALNRSVPVRNPTSRRVSDLDRALLSGVVRHPDSAHFDQTGTMFVLGHSSRLPNVVNENFQAFNDIEDLTWGDTIRVYSTDTMYVYRVENVYEAKATVASVPIAGDTQTLTLATCNSFGTKDDRFIVEASLVREQDL